MTLNYSKYTGYTIDELQNMTVQELKEEFPQTNARWKKEYDTNMEGIIRAIAFAAVKEDWTESGLREFWYNPCKPILMKSPDFGARKERADKKVSSVLSNLVKQGCFKYSDLGVYDVSTKRKIYEKKERAKCWSDIILFVEKDAAYMHLLPLQDLFNITIISGGGWSSTAGIEALLSQIKGKGIQEVSIYSLVDYDPSGFEIDREFARKCRTLGINVLHHERIGVDPNWMEPQLRDVQKYPLSKPGNMSQQKYERWKEKYAINDKFGLEIEAISGQPEGAEKLRVQVAKVLLDRLDETNRIEEIVQPLWEDVPKYVIKRLVDDETWKFFQEVEEPFELGEYVKPGEYKSRKEEIQEEKKEEEESWEDNIEYAEGEVEAWRNTLKRREAEVRDKYEEKISEKEEKFVKPIQEKIEELKKKKQKREEKYIKPLREEKQTEIGRVRSQIKPKIRAWRERVDEKKSKQKEAIQPFNKKLEVLAKKFKRSRHLYAKAYLIWLRNNIDYYMEKGLEGEEDLSFGLTEGIHIDAVKQGQSVDDLIQKAERFDETRVYDRIATNIERGKLNVGKILRAQIDEYKRAEDKSD